MYYKSILLGVPTRRR